MNRLLPPLAALLLILAVGTVHGLKTDRWGIPRDLVADTAKLGEIPTQIAGWSSAEIEMDPQQLQMAEAIGHLSRQYTLGGSDGRDSMNVLLLGGRHGPISVHPPTVCFTAAGFALQTMPQKVDVTIGKARHSFWVADFQKTTDGLPLRTRTFWAWNGGSSWLAADKPRREFAGSPLLYKLYVTRIVAPDDVPADDAALADDPAVDFMKTFLPVADAYVFPAQ